MRKASLLPNHIFQYSSSEICFLCRTLYIGGSSCTYVLLAFYYKTFFQLTKKKNPSFISFFLPNKFWKMSQSVAIIGTLEEGGLSLVWLLLINCKNFYYGLIFDWRQTTWYTFQNWYIRKYPISFTKGQLISKCLFDITIWTKIPPKKLTNSALEWVGQNLSNFLVVFWSKWFEINWPFICV